MMIFINHESSKSLVNIAEAYTLSAPEFFLLLYKEHIIFTCASILGSWQVV